MRKLLLITMLATSLVACGGGDSSSPSSEATPQNTDALRQSSLAGRVHASQGKAEGMDPNKRAPWTAAPAWVAGTAYAKNGYIVQNSGNLYMLQMAGTSASAGGPSGTGMGPITDNTAKWFYIGPVVAPALNAPTVTISSGHTGLSKLVPYNQAGAFFFSGGVPTVNSFGYKFPIANRAPSMGNAVGTYDVGSPTITFMSDAPKLVVQGQNNMYPDGGLQIEADGRWAAPGLLVPLATQADGGVTIDWGGARKMRKYRIWIANNYPFYGIYVDTASLVTAPKNAERFRVVVNGDSLTAGAAGFPALGKSWPDTFSYITGCDDIYSVAVGGTGFINNANGAATTFAQRLPDVVALQPDVHVVAGLFNDQGYTSGQRQSAILDYIQTFRRSSRAKLFMFGSIGGGIPASVMATYENDMKAAVQASNDPDVVFFPVSTDAVPWMDGTGTVGKPVGDGNSDAYTLPVPDAPHLTQLGHDYMAAKYANAWAGYWATHD